MSSLTKIIYGSIALLLGGCNQYQIAGHNIEREAIVQARSALDTLMEEYDADQDGTLTGEEARVMVEDIEDALKLKRQLDLLRENHPRLYEIAQNALERYEQNATRE